MEEMKVFTDEKSFLSFDRKLCKTKQGRIPICSHMVYVENRYLVSVILET